MQRGNESLNNKMQRGAVKDKMQRGALDKQSKRREELQKATSSA